MGLQLHACLQTIGQVITAGWVQSPLPPMLALDLTDHQNIRQVVAEAKPDVIINAAAYTAVDKAESDSDTAMAINATAVGILAEEALKRHALLVHYSTDYVFNGKRCQPYHEDVTPDPRSVYGETKLAGEQAIQTVGGDYLILRTAWVYGLYGSNFLRTMQRLANERERLSVVADQIGSPTWSFTLAQATSQILNLYYSPFCTLSKAHMTGLYHLTAQGQTSWYGFAHEILRYSQQADKLAAITTEDYPTPATRPAYSVLATDKIQTTFGLHLPQWQQALAVCMALRG